MADVSSQATSLGANPSDTCPNSQVSSRSQNQLDTVLGAIYDNKIAIVPYEDLNTDIYASLTAFIRHSSTENDQILAQGSITSDVSFQAMDGNRQEDSYLPTEIPFSEISLDLGLPTDTKLPSRPEARSSSRPAILPQWTTTISQQHTFSLLIDDVVSRSMSLFDQFDHHEVTGKTLKRQLSQIQPETQMGPSSEMRYHKHLRRDVMPASQLAPTRSSSSGPETQSQQQPLLPSIDVSSMGSTTTPYLSNSSTDSPGDDATDTSDNTSQQQCTSSQTRQSTLYRRRSPVKSVASQRTCTGGLYTRHATRSVPPSHHQSNTPTSTIHEVEPRASSDHLLAPDAATTVLIQPSLVSAQTESTTKKEEDRDIKQSTETETSPGRDTSSTSSHISSPFSDKATAQRICLDAYLESLYLLWIYASVPALRQVFLIDIGTPYIDDILDQISQIATPIQTADAPPSKLSADRSSHLSLSEDFTIFTADNVTLRWPGDRHALSTCKWMPGMSESALYQTNHVVDASGTPSSNENTEKPLPLSTIYDHDTLFLRIFTPFFTKYEQFKLMLLQLFQVTSVSDLYVEFLSILIELSTPYRCNALSSSGSGSISLLHNNLWSFHAHIALNGWHQLLTQFFQACHLPPPPPPPVDSTANGFLTHAKDWLVNENQLRVKSKGESTNHDGGFRSTMCCHLYMMYNPQQQSPTGVDSFHCLASRCVADIHRGWKQFTSSMLISHLVPPQSCQTILNTIIMKLHTRHIARNQLVYMFDAPFAAYKSFIDVQRRRLQPLKPTPEPSPPGLSTHPAHPTHSTTSTQSSLQSTGSLHRSVLILPLLPHYILCPFHRVSSLYGPKHHIHPHKNHESRDLCQAETQCGMMTSSCSTIAYRHFLHCIMSNPGTTLDDIHHYARQYSICPSQAFRLVSPCASIIFGDVESLINVRTSPIVRSFNHNATGTAPPAAHDLPLLLSSRIGYSIEIAMNMWRSSILSSPVIISPPLYFPSPQLHIISFCHPSTSGAASSSPLYQCLPRYNLPLFDLFCLEFLSGYSLYIYYSCQGHVQQSHHEHVPAPPLYISDGPLQSISGSSPCAGDTSLMPSYTSSDLLSLFNTHTHLHQALSAIYLLARSMTQYIIKRSAASTNSRVSSSSSFPSSPPAASAPQLPHPEVGLDFVAIVRFLRHQTHILASSTSFLSENTFGIDYTASLHDENDQPLEGNISTLCWNAYTAITNSVALSQLLLWFQMDYTSWYDEIKQAHSCTQGSHSNVPGISTHFSPYNIASYMKHTVFPQFSKFLTLLLRADMDDPTHQLNSTTGQHSDTSPHHVYLHGLVPSTYQEVVLKDYSPLQSYLKTVSPFHSHNHISGQDLVGSTALSQESARSGVIKPYDTSLLTMSQMPLRPTTPYKSIWSHFVAFFRYCPLEDLTMDVVARVDTFHRDKQQAMYEFYEARRHNGGIDVNITKTLSSHNSNDTTRHHATSTSIFPFNLFLSVSGASYEPISPRSTGLPTDQHLHTASKPQIAATHGAISPSKTISRLRFVDDLTFQFLHTSASFTQMMDKRMFVRPTMPSVPIPLPFGLFSSLPVVFHQYIAAMLSFSISNALSSAPSVSLSNASSHHTAQNDSNKSVIEQNRQTYLRSLLCKAHQSMYLTFYSLVCSKRHLLSPRSPGSEVPSAKNGTPHISNPTLTKDSSDSNGEPDIIKKNQSIYSRRRAANNSNPVSPTESAQHAPIHGKNSSMVDILGSLQLKNSTTYASDPKSTHIRPFLDKSGIIIPKQCLSVALSLQHQFTHLQKTRHGDFSMRASHQSHRSTHPQSAVNKSIRIFCGIDLSESNLQCIEVYSKDGMGQAPPLSSSPSRNTDDHIHKLLLTGASPFYRSQQQHYTPFLPRNIQHLLLKRSYFQIHPSNRQGNGAGESPSPGMANPIDLCNDDLPSNSEHDSISHPRVDIPLDTPNVRNANTYSSSSSSSSSSSTNSPQTHSRKRDGLADDLPQPPKIIETKELLEYRQLAEMLRKMRLICKELEPQVARQQQAQMSRVPSSTSSFSNYNFQAMSATCQINDVVLSHASYEYYPKQANIIPSAQAIAEVAAQSPPQSYSKKKSKKSRSKYDNNTAIIYQLLTDAKTQHNIVCFTDGSALKNPGPCGSGILIRVPSTLLESSTIKTLLRAIPKQQRPMMGTNTSITYTFGASLGCDAPNNYGEMKGIEVCLHFIYQLTLANHFSLCGRKIYIVSDSEWAINILTGKYKPNKSYYGLSSAIRTLIYCLEKSHQCVIEFVWVKGHNASHDNDQVDRYAKNAAKYSQTHFKAPSQAILADPIIPRDLLKVQFIEQHALSSGSVTSSLTTRMQEKKDTAINLDSLTQIDTSAFITRFKAHLQDLGRQFTLATRLIHAGICLPLVEPKLQSAPAPHVPAGNPPHQQQSVPQAKPRSPGGKSAPPPPDPPLSPSVQHSDGSMPPRAAHSAAAAEATCGSHLKSTRGDENTPEHSLSSKPKLSQQVYDLQLLQSGSNSSILDQHQVYITALSRAILFNIMSLADVDSSDYVNVIRDSHQSANSIQASRKSFRDSAQLPISYTDGMYEIYSLFANMDDLQRCMTHVIGMMQTIIPPHSDDHHAVKQDQDVWEVKIPPSPILQSHNLSALATTFIEFQLHYDADSHDTIVYQSHQCHTAHHHASEHQCHYTRSITVHFMIYASPQSYLFVKSQLDMASLPLLCHHHPIQDVPGDYPAQRSHKMPQKTYRLLCCVSPLVFFTQWISQQYHLGESIRDQSVLLFILQELCARLGAYMNYAPSLGPTSNMSTSSDSREKSGNQSNLNQQNLSGLDPQSTSDAAFNPSMLRPYQLSFPRGTLGSFSHVLYTLLASLLDSDSTTDSSSFINPFAPTDPGLNQSPGCPVTKVPSPSNISNISNMDLLSVLIALVFFSPLQQYLSIIQQCGIPGFDFTGNPPPQRAANSHSGTFNNSRVQMHTNGFHHEIHDIMEDITVDVHCYDPYVALLSELVRPFLPPALLLGTNELMNVISPSI